jgi:hypothetical protein
MHIYQDSNTKATKAAKDFIEDEKTFNFNAPATTGCPDLAGLSNNQVQFNFGYSGSAFSPAKTAATWHPATPVGGGFVPHVNLNNQLLNGCSIGVPETAQQLRNNLPAGLADLADIVFPPVTLSPMDELIGLQGINITSHLPRIPNNISPAEYSRRMTEIDAVLQQGPQLDSQDEQLGTEGSRKKRLVVKDRWDITPEPVTPPPPMPAPIVVREDASDEEKRRASEINARLAEEKKIRARARNNESAKRSRLRREQLICALKDAVAKVEAERDYWKMKAISLGAGGGDWESILPIVRELRIEMYYDSGDRERYRRQCRERAQNKVQPATQQNRLPVPVVGEGNLVAYFPEEETLNGQLSHGHLDQQLLPENFTADNLTEEDCSALDESELQERDGHYHGVN